MLQPDDGDIVLQDELVKRMWSIPNVNELAFNLTAKVPPTPANLEGVVMLLLVADIARPTVLGTNKICAVLSISNNSIPLFFAPNAWDAVSTFLVSTE